MPGAHTVTSGNRVSRQRQYRWDANQRLKQITNALGKGAVSFGHDDFGNLAWAQYEDGLYDYRLPDKAGNLFHTQTRSDRKYGPGGKLLETQNARFVYDDEGNLVKKIVTAAPMGMAIWEYEWNGNGMLSKVVRPDGSQVVFLYDPLGRRIEKQYKNRLTRFVWDGNVPLHEWTYPAKDKPLISINELGEVVQDHPEPVPQETLATWVFEEGTFTPAAKLINGKQYSIITDYLGTPSEAYDETGEKVWACELDIYGKVRKLEGDKCLVPFRYQGQYEDEETGLYYNRYRHYDPGTGNYISQDPIGLTGGTSLYRYVKDSNSRVDIFGLSSFDPFAVGEITDFPDNIKFGQNRAAPNFSTIGSQADDAIVGQPVRSVGEAIKRGDLSPDKLVISYTKTPSGEIVTLNNRGLAAITIGEKNPSHAIFVPYDKVPPHLKSDPPSNSIKLTNDKKGLEVLEVVTRGCK